MEGGRTKEEMKNTLIESESYSCPSPNQRGPNTLQRSIFNK